MSKQPLSEDQQLEYAMELAMELGPTATQTQALRATLELLKDKGITSEYNWYSMILLVETIEARYPKYANALVDDDDEGILILFQQLTSVGGVLQGLTERDSNAKVH
jgi:hypothetical protein